MSFDFSQFKPVTSTNTRKEAKPRGQRFQFRYRKDKTGQNSYFVTAEKVWERLNLDNKALIQLSNPTTGQTLLAVVDNDKGTIYNHSEKQAAKGLKKGRKFKSTIIEEALHNVGLIDMNLLDKNQNLDLKEVATNVQIAEGVTAYSVLEIVKDENTYAPLEAGELEDDEDEVGNVSASDSIQAQVSETPATSTEEEEF